MIGKTISHYKITEELGRGGMGVVYKAEDLNLGRIVAIKFLSHHLGSDPEATKRFVNEAKAASALDHQHIGTIHEANETEDGLTYIVMAYYEGETLRERIDRGGFSLDEAMEIARQVASGLGKAHEKGIIHRDIKPSNIMITADGVVKILDFGLAKLMGSTKITRTGSAMGTAAYMSPEQARSEEVDHRSDIFSFGSILYEMLAGERPFKGEHEAALLYSIVHEEPAPLERVKPAMSTGLIDIVGHAMEKKAEERYQSIEEISRDLKQLEADEAYSPKGMSAGKKAFEGRRLTALLIMAGIVAIAAILLYVMWPGEGEMPDTRKVIAVLPFQNIGSSEDEYFADGLTEEIIARLAKVKDIGVIARTSVLAYKNTEKSIKEIGRELGADHILEGTVRWSKKPDGSSKVRITPQLIKVSDETHIWADIFEEPLEDIFDVQSSIAMAILGELDVALKKQELDAIEDRPTENLEAYDYFLHGMDYYSRGNSFETQEKAIENFSKAVELDSTYAKAHAWLSIAYAAHYWQQGGIFQMRGIDPEPIMENARLEAETALRLDSNLSDAYLAYANYIVKQSGDNELALQYAMSANELEPNNPSVLMMLGGRMRSMGRWDEGLKYMQKAIELDPRSSLKLFSLLGTYMNMREFEKAKQIYRRMCLLETGECLSMRELIIKMHLGEETQEYARKLKESEASEEYPRRLFYFMYWDHAIFRMYYDEFDDMVEEITINAFGEFKNRYYYLRAYYYERNSDLKMRDAYYDSLINYVHENEEAVIQNHILDLHLGIAYGQRGMKNEAIEVAKKVEEMWPFSKSTMSASEGLVVAAIIYTASGEHDRALDLVDTLLSVPGYLTVLLLERDPIWAPLRDHPRYNSIISK